MYISKETETRRTALTDQQLDEVRGAGFFDDLLDTVKAVRNVMKEATEEAIYAVGSIFCGEDEREVKPQVMPGFNVVEH